MTDAAVVALIAAKREPDLVREQYFVQLAAGVEDYLTRHNIRLITRLATSREHELEIIRHLRDRKSVDSFILLDIEQADPRLDLLEQAGLAFTPNRETTIAAREDDGIASVTQRIIQHLWDHGYSSVVRLSGPPQLEHTQVRDRAYSTIMRSAERTPIILEGDYLEGSGRDALAAAVADGHLERAPVAFIADNDLMSVGVLKAAMEQGFNVPSDVGVVSWDDSLICQTSEPTITAVANDPYIHGSIAAANAVSSLGKKPQIKITSADAPLMPRATTRR